MTRVLWADDRVELAQTLSHHLAGLACEITYVDSADRALDELKSGQFELCILDLQMPPGIWGGLTLLEQMHRLGLNVAVIVVSGAGSQLETIKALRLGAIDYVMKDCAESELAGRVGAALKQARERCSTRDLVLGGESGILEFKQTLRWNVREGKVDKRIEHASLKTLAAFLNSAGGTLLVGVSDAGRIVGLADDGFPDSDALLLHLDNLVSATLGGTASTFLRASLDQSMDLPILRIDCRPSRSPVFVRSLAGDDREFYVRRSASTSKLRTDEVLEYVQVRFGDPSR